MYVIMEQVQTVYPMDRENSIKNFLNLRYDSLWSIITKGGRNRKGERDMEGKSRFGRAVLALLAGFILFCAGWYLSRTSSPESYQVITTRRPVEEASVPAEQEENARPDSLLPGETIDVNTADVYDLQRLPGIGEKRAQDIIAYREENGPFQTLDELTNVSGIGPVILENLREYVTTGSE